MLNLQVKLELNLQVLQELVDDDLIFVQYYPNLAVAEDGKEQRQTFVHELNAVIFGLHLKYSIFIEIAFGKVFQELVNNSLIFV